MRIIRKTVVLALAGLGVYKAWEIVNANLPEARRRAGNAKARIEPALHDTEDTIQTATEDVSASIHDLSQTVADTVASAGSSPSSAPMKSDAPLNSAR